MEPTPFPTRTLMTIGVTVVSFMAIGCSPESVTDDTDKNKSVFVDGYTEPTTPAPASAETTCNYSKVAELGLPTGVGPGQVLPVGLSWEGFRPGEDAPSTIYASEFYDCDGSKGIDAVLWDVSQYG